MSVPDILYRVLPDIAWRARSTIPPVHSVAALSLPLGPVPYARGQYRALHRTFVAGYHHALDVNTGHRIARV
eukprot:1255212-Rhodomonas_salina.2